MVFISTLNGSLVNTHFLFAIDRRFFYNSCAPYSNKFSLFQLVESLAEVTENGTRDMHSDTLVRLFFFYFLRKVVSMLLSQFFFIFRDLFLYITMEFSFVNCYLKLILPYKGIGDASLLIHLASTLLCILMLKWLLHSN